MATIYEMYGFSPHRMTIALMEAADVASMVPKGGRVALKPNLVAASSPDQGATTHAGVLSGAIQYLREQEARQADTRSDAMFSAPPAHSMDGGQNINPAELTAKL